MPRAGGGGGSYAGLVLEVVAGSGAGYTGKILEYSDADHAVQVAPPVPGGAGALVPPLPSPTLSFKLLINNLSPFPVESNWIGSRQPRPSADRPMAAQDPTSRLRVVLNLVSHAVGVGSSHQARPHPRPPQSRVVVTAVQ